MRKLSTLHLLLRCSVRSHIARIMTTEASRTGHSNDDPTMPLTPIAHSEIRALRAARQQKKSVWEIPMMM